MSYLRPRQPILTCDHRCRQQKKKFCPRERLHLDKKCPGKLINTLDSLARDSETTLGPFCIALHDVGSL